MSGPSPLVVACLLLFIEEAGVPIPLPGEAVLIGAGILVTSGATPWWLGLPALYVAVAAGALTGYAWSRRLGFRRLRSLAAKLRFGKPFERVAGRLREAGWRQVMISRLIPGLRIYTTLVAGGVEMPLRRFLAAMLPGALAWVAVFALLGIFVGIPAERFLGRIEAYALRAGAVILILVAGYIVIRQVPDSRPRARDVPVGGRRAYAAFALDLITVGALITALNVLTGIEAGEIDTGIAGAVLLSALAVIYLLIARRSVGHTMGELAFRVRYR